MASTMAAKHVLAEIKSCHVRAVASLEKLQQQRAKQSEANLALEKHLISVNNQWTIQEEVDWWEENQQFSIKYWRDSEEYLQLMSEKSQNTLYPDPDFVVSDSYPKNVLRRHCDSL